MQNSSGNYSRAQPLRSELKERVKLNKAGSIKSTYHLVFNLQGSGLTYHPGDSLAVLASNPDSLVELVLEKFRLPCSSVSDEMKNSLRNSYLLNRVSKKFVKAIAEKLKGSENGDRLLKIADQAETLDEYCFTRDYVDVLNEHPQAELTVEEFISLLSPVQPRLYSIASSQALHNDEVHLTVAVVHYETHNRAKYGFASGFLGEFSRVGDTIPIYTQPTRHFHMPASKDAPMIMVGPGTGIAPFRAFLQQRQVEGTTGKNWLFFGDQHKACDFLYGEELEKWHAQGLLQRFNTAFSRDQEHKIYVQHRMKEHGKELWDWLQQGAYFYVCGDAKRMAKDVHQALIEIAQSEGGLSPEKAQEYVNVTLPKTEKRYLKDVY